MDRKRLPVQKLNRVGPSLLVSAPCRLRTATRHHTEESHAIGCDERQGDTEMTQIESARCQLRDAARFKLGFGGAPLP